MTGPPASSLRAIVAHQVKRMTAGWGVEPSMQDMNGLLRLMAKWRAGALAAVTNRFCPTLDIVRVDQQAKVFDQPAWLSQLGHLDQLLATWEWRMSPTPCLVMRPRQA